MSGRDAGKTGIATAGGVEVRLMGSCVREEGATNKVSDAAGFEGSGGLKGFEFEEDTTGGVESALWRRTVDGKDVYTILQL